MLNSAPPPPPPPPPSSSQGTAAQMYQFGTQAAQHVGHNVPQQMGQQMGQQMVQQMGQQTGQQMNQRMGQPMGQHMGQHVGQHMSQHMGQHTSPPVVHSMGQQMAPLAVPSTVPHMGQQIGHHMSHAPHQTVPSNPHMGQPVAPPSAPPPSAPPPSAPPPSAPPPSAPPPSAPPPSAPPPSAPPPQASDPMSLTSSIPSIQPPQMEISTAAPGSPSSLASENTNDFDSDGSDEDDDFDWGPSIKDPADRERASTAKKNRQGAASPPPPPPPPQPSHPQPPIRGGYRGHARGIGKDFNMYKIPHPRPKYDWAQEPNCHMVVANCSLGCAINCRVLAQNIDNTEFPSEGGGSGCVMRLRNPRVACTVFPNGTVNCMGAKTEATAKIALRQIARKIQMLHNKGIKQQKEHPPDQDSFVFSAVRFGAFTLSSVNGTAKLPFQVDLEEFSREHMDEAIYEPDMFEDNVGGKALQFLMSDPKVTLKIFHTGSINANATTAEEFFKAMNKIYPICLKFKRESFFFS